MSSGESKDSGFRVTDRRSFNDADPPAAPTPPAAVAASPAGPKVRESAAASKLPESAAAPSAASGASAFATDETTGLPAVDFHTFVLSLGSSALLHLGELEYPDAGGPQKDLPLAKHTIDILAMLDEKTRGNLTPPEEKLISSLLYDLRLRYVEATKAG